MTKTRPNLNGFGDSEESIKIYNIIGEKYHEASLAEKEQFIKVAEAKAIELGSEQNNFAQMFRQLHSKCALANVKTYFLHAAHVVWGMSFDLSVKARSSQATTVHVMHQGQPLTITIESE